MEPPPQCCVCLKTAPNLRQINETDDDRSLATKLQSCVPEIEWKEEYRICPPCSTDLNLVYEFRERCLRRDPPPQNKKVKSESNPTHEDNVKTFQCQICESKFSCLKNLTQHMIYHEGKRIYVCTFCGKGYITRKDLTVHEKIHLNKREYKCPFCPKCFNTHKDIRTHKLVVHTDPYLWRHVCNLCLKRFPTKSNFDAHMRTHTNERPFGCHLCEKKFLAKHTLQKHFLSHTNERAFACDVCKREYKDRRVMEIHKKRIHGIGDVKVPERVKKYLCHLCPKAYFDKSKLTRHLCSHTGEKPHFCRVCQRKFVDKSYVKQHMRKAHNVEETKKT